MTAFGTNILHFAQILRRAGLSIGPGKITAALEALPLIDIGRRDDVFHTLRALFVERHAQDEVFSLAFDRFFRAPGADDAFRSETRDTDASDEGGTAIAVSWSGAETLRQKDFAAMSPPEIAEAKRLIAKLQLSPDENPTRRFRAGERRDAIDMRATLRAMVRAGGLIDFQHRQRVKRPPSLVVLCDISGSMDPYNRMLLRFLHALSTDRDRVHVFLFGTRLTNITREITRCDPDKALARVSSRVADWSGGTRIGHSLGDFNRLWSRRVLSQGAVVLLITDGLDRDDGGRLAIEMAHLHRASRHLIWLNPLLRYAAFEPKAAGIRAMLPHVDDFRPVHNLDSLTGLIAALNAPTRMAA